jgi:hypothetical protein
MAESSADLQNQLNSFQDYCSIWKLKVNTDKSKVIIFSRGKLSRNLNFSLNGEKLEIVNSLDFVPLYIFTIILCILPFMLFKSDLYQRPSLQTLSNALSNSIKAQHILFFLFLRISKAISMDYKRFLMKLKSNLVYI